MQYNIINSGSDGNAVVVNNEILIDCGVNFKKLELVYKKIKLVLLTHIHNDHFNKTTIKRLAKERPGLRFGCCEWLLQELLDLDISKNRIDVYNFETGYCYNNNLSIESFKLFHDVPQCGYKLFMNSKSLIYATDTCSLEGVEAKNFDVYLIEANYEDELELHNRAENKFYEERVKKTHMSVENATKWLLENMSDTSIYEFLHQHKEKKLAKRFIEIRPLLEKVTNITNEKYNLTDYDIYSAIEDLLKYYEGLEEEFSNYKNNSKIIYEEDYEPCE